MEWPAKEYSLAFASRRMEASLYPGPVGGCTGAAAATAILLGLFLAMAAQVARPEQAVYEKEPNNTPAQANRISGAATLIGTMVKGDQDGFVWTVSDNDARKRWTFELQGIPGALTVTEVIRVEYAENGTDVKAMTRLMKMGTRDGSRPSIARDLLFEPGQYILGIAYAGGEPFGEEADNEQSAGFRPPATSLSFGERGAPQVTPEGTAPAKTEPGAYRFVISEGSDLRVSRKSGAAKSRGQAREIDLGDEFATFESREVSWYAMTFDEQAAAQRWEVSAQVPIGRHLHAELTDANGMVLSEQMAGARGRLRIADLGPPVGTWYLKLVSKTPGAIQAVKIRTVGALVSGEETEPNGEWERANRVVLDQPLKGWSSESRDTDFFRFATNEDTADRLHTLVIEASPAARLEFCLLDGHGDTLQCRRAKTPIELPDLLLTPGHWGIRVSRVPDGAEYRVTLVDQGPVRRGVEVEPNDALEIATTVPEKLRIKGRIAGEDEDFLRFTIADKPQLWRFQVIGAGLDEVAYYDAGGKRAARIRPKRHQRRIRLENQFLLPGQHYIKISGKQDADYTLLARAQGLPDPDGEREPNDDLSQMQRLAIGQTRTGTLSDPEDKDTYGFFLAHRDHIRLTIEPPADGEIQPELFWYGKSLARAQGAEAGDPVTVSGLFPPGDYHMELTTRQASEMEYRLSLERLPRFSCPADCEPSGFANFHGVSPLPGDLVLEGRAGEWSDSDDYLLPAFDQPTELVVHTGKPPRMLSLGHGRRESEMLDFDPDAGEYRVMIPAGKPRLLIVENRGEPYRLALDFDDSAGLEPITGPLPAELELSLDKSAVSAYRRDGQSISGSVTVRSVSADVLAAHLNATTSDYRWTVDLQQEQVKVGPQAGVSVPLEVRVPPDAWAGRPVRISVALDGPDGALVETWQDISVERDILPVNPHQAWQIPESLRGGVNAAWAPFGAEWAEPMPDGQKFAYLRDGLVFRNRRMGCCGSAYGWKEDYRPVLTLDLPGESPLPVSGVALNHFGSPDAFRTIRKAVVLVSQDGIEFEEVLRLETLPVETEQYFSLETPVLSRQVRLRIDETFERPSGQSDVALGEWKVILAPGHDLSGGQGFNLAAPALGGHIVWDDPPRFYKPKSVLNEEKQWYSVNLKPGENLEYVIGFHHDRVAQIRRVEWVYADDVPRERHFDRVLLSLSAESPVGPWQPVGELAATKAGAELKIDLPTPGWARFVKFTAIADSPANTAVSPATIRVWERPTGETYRSILGEWGQASRQSYYEEHKGVVDESIQASAGNDSRDHAAPIKNAQPVLGQVALGSHEHWYRLQAPGGKNTLTVTLTGDPGVRTVPALEDGSGAPISLRRVSKRSEPDRHVYEAVIQPGEEVFIRIYEPPRNVVFSWDTSASVAPYLPTIFNALVAFSGQVIPGQEAVNLVPFGRGTLLRDWYGEPYVLQTILNDYRREESSSAAEKALKESALALEPLPGTRSIVVITDGITTPDGTMWEAMRNIEPRIFGVQVGGAEDWNQDVFQDWASVNGGHYTQLFHAGEMEVAFDRAATLMRRPADYTLTVTTAYREAPGPGLLEVMSADAGAAAAAGGAAVELILDASGSMLQHLGGKRRIAIAKEVLTEAIRDHIPAGTPVAMRVFGHREPDACLTDLEIPLAPLDPEAAVARIESIQAMNLARTPIADSLAAVARDLKDARGRSAIVLVTDGEETCDGDPAKVIESLREQGMDVSLNIVGFAIDDADLEARFRQWAEAGDGRYFSARDEAGLSTSLREALQVPYVVYDQTSDRVAEGLVDGPPVELEQGYYRVVVDGAAARIFENVQVPGEKRTTLELD